MDLLKKMESVQQRADQVDLKAEQRNKELTGQLQNLEATIVVIQELNTRLVGTLSKFSGRFNHIISSIDRIETHLEDKIDNINTCIEHNGKLTRDLTERVSGFEERQHNDETKLQQLEKMYTEGTMVAEMVRRDELNDSLVKLREELGTARSELRSNIADAASVADIDGIGEQLGELRAQLQATDGQPGGHAELAGAVEELRAELAQTREDLQDGLASAAPTSDVGELGRQVEELSSLLRTMTRDTVSRPELDGTVKGLRDELDRARAELREGQTGASSGTSSEELDSVKAQVEGLSAQLKKLATDSARLKQREGDTEKLGQALEGLRADLDSVEGAVSDLGGAASAEDLDALREELAHAVTDLEAVRSTADTGASADLVGRDELDASSERLRGELETTAEKLRSELAQTRTELSGDLAAADDVFALREQLASHGTELEAVTSDVVKSDELAATVDKLRAELDDARYQLRGSLSGAATTDALEALEEKLTGALAELEAPGESLGPEDLKSALNDLRFEFSAITDDLRHSVAGAASADDLDAIKQRMAGNTAEFKAVASAVMPEEMEAKLNKLRDEQMAALEGMRKKLDGVALASDLASVRDQIASSTENLEAVSKAATRDDLTVTAAMLREDMSLSQAEVEKGLKTLKQQLELALNDIEFIRSAQAEQGSGSVEDLRIEMAAVQATLQESAPSSEAKDIEGLHKQFVGLAMDVSSTETEMKKRLDELQRKNRMLEQDIRKRLIASEGAGPVAAGADASMASIRREMEKITTGYARKSEVNTSIKETNAAFRKIVQDFDTKQAELRAILSAEGDAHIQKQNEKTEEAMSRFQHMINEFRQQMEASVEMQKEFKDLKQQMILTQNAIMELNQFVEDQLKKQG